jgi:penicillin-binding protein-related factor A (putative recombinase)
MKEQQLNTTIKNGFQELGFASKISDGIGGLSVQNPFDGFAVNSLGFFYWEAKIIKPLKAWNFNTLEDHQFKNMNLIKNLQPTSYTLYPIGAFEPRKYFYLFIFDSELVKYLRIDENKKSVLKKEFNQIIDLEQYLSIKRNKVSKKYEVDFDKLEEKIITKEYWINNIKKEK